MNERAMREYGMWRRDADEIQCPDGCLQRKRQVDDFIKETLLVRSIVDLVH